MKEAKPIWEIDKEKEKNYMVGFYTKFSYTSVNKNQEVKLSITGSTIYRIFLNGKFYGHGPARAAHGYYRVDVINLKEVDLQEENSLVIEVAGYNINSFYTLDQPSFLQAEVSCGSQILTATNEHGKFSARRLCEFRQKVQRYSFQRPFIEAYQLREGYQAWRTLGILEEEKVELQEVEEKKLLERHVGYSTYERKDTSECIAYGKFQVKNDLPVWEDRALNEISPMLKGFPERELELCVSKTMDQLQTTELRKQVETEKKKEVVKEQEFLLFDLFVNRTGFLGGRIFCDEDSKIAFVFDEVLINEDVQYNRMCCVNVIAMELEKGEYEIETFQPYTMRYVKLMVLKGSVKLEGLYLRELKNPDARRAEFSCSDKGIEQIFEAGIETFEQNAVDIYMDCPSRERAGWLCDSFFTARVEHILTGATLVEDNFIENYNLPEKFMDLPEGMIPMCYPADHKDGGFIPNWAMWFILELKEYKKRNEDNTLVTQLEARVEGILTYLAQFENEYGLLEDLENWVFVEWSKANDLTAGVNYPSNMLYAEALLTAGYLYQREDFRKKGEQLKETIRKMSFTGEFFADQALREDGKLILVDEITEVCQYYAFVFQIATKERYPKLYETLITKFGPFRDVTTTYPRIHKANAFIGNYLRIEILSQYGLADQMIKETKEFFSYMAERTGTLWENTGAYASCNHGFASHIIFCYYRDLLGIRQIDQKAKKISIRRVDVDLSYCTGKVPVGTQWIEIRYHKDSKGVTYELVLPEGWQVDFNPIDEA